MNNLNLILGTGWFENIERCPSPNFSKRCPGTDINLIVIHNISLPPGIFGNNYIDDLFLNKLDPNSHPYFKTIEAIQVSAHLLINRLGYVKQYVSLNDKAWHAGVSSYEGRDDCNNFSIGIELEGTDSVAYTKSQYWSLIGITNILLSTYKSINKNRIVGHSDIAPDRKTDPGISFDWKYFKSNIRK